MKKLLPLVLAAVIFLTACSDTVALNNQDNSSDNVQSGKSDTSSRNSNKTVHAAAAPIEQMHNTATKVFADILSKDVENTTIKIFYDENGDCEILSDGGCPKSTLKEFTKAVSLASCYVEVCLDSRFTESVGISLVQADDKSDIPDVMPNSFNFADGTFDGDLSKIRTCPELEEGVSLAEYEFNNMTDCIEQLNVYAQAGANVAKTVFVEMAGSYYDAQYTQYYGNATTILSSDKKGRWSVSDATILTEECAQRIAEKFNHDNTLSAAANCTIQMMFYMEHFVGVSANYSADKKFFATYDVSFWETYKAPYEESYQDKSFLYWYGVDGCLMAKNGRLCPVGTYCISTGEPLGMYLPPSLMGTWQSVTVGNESFAEYAEKVSDGVTDYSNILFKISESSLIVSNIGSPSVYDILKTDKGYDVIYHGAERSSGSIIDNNDTLTLYLRHPFTYNDMTLPIVLARADSSQTNTNTSTGAGIGTSTDKPTKKPEILSAEEHAAQDTETHNLLDLSGERVMGQQISNPNVLSWWRNYAANGGSYTIETYCAGAMRLEYDLYSFDGKNGYHRWDLTSHDEPSEPVSGMESIYFDDYIYNSYYNIDRYDLRKFDCYYNDDDVSFYCPLFGSEEYDPLHFVKAYTITIGGVEYVAEEWQMGDHDNGYIVYSIDGFIVGYEGKFDGKPVTYTITRFDMEGDSGLIRIPENVKEKTPTD